MARLARAVIPGIAKRRTLATQGNRVKESWDYEACEEVVIPCGDLASEA